MRQYKLRLVDRNTKSCAAWQGAVLRLTLAYADSGEPVLTAAIRSDRYWKRRKSDSDQALAEPSGLADPKAPPLLVFHDLTVQGPSGPGPRPSQGPTPAVEVLLRMGRDGDTVGTFGLLASTFRHDRRAFALRIDVSREPDDPFKFETMAGGIECTAQARRPRDSATAETESSGADTPAETPRTPSSRRRSAPGGKRGLDELIKVEPATPSIPSPAAFAHVKIEPGVSSAPPPADFRVYGDVPLPADPLLLGAVPVSPKESPSTRSGPSAGGSPSDLSNASTDGLLEDALDRLHLEDKAGGAYPDAIVDLEDLEKAPYHATRPGRYSKIFNELHQEVERLLERPDAEEPHLEHGRVFLPAAAPAWLPAAPAAALELDPLHPAAFLFPSRTEADAVVARVAAAFNAPGALTTPAGLDALSSALSEPRLLSTELFNTFDGHFRVQSMFYRLQEAGQHAVVECVLQAHRARLLALLRPEDPAEASRVATCLMEFVTAVTTWMGPAPADLLPMGPAPAAELLQKAGELLEGHQEAAPLACCDLLYRRAMLCFQTGDEPRALALCYEAWAELIRRRLYPSRVDARVVRSCMLLGLRVPGHLPQAKSVQGRVYWFDESDEDAVDRATNLQILSAAQSMRADFAQAGRLIDAAVDALEATAAAAVSHRVHLARAHFLKALSSIHLRMFGTAVRSWKRCFRLLLDACSGPGDVHWDIVWLIRDHVMRIGRANEFHSPATLVRLLRLLLSIIKLSDGRNATPLRAHTLAVYGELLQRTGAHGKAAACFAESLALLQGRWPLLFVDSHPRVARLRDLLAEAEAAAGSAPAKEAKPRGFFSRLLRG